MARIDAEQNTTYCEFTLFRWDFIFAYFADGAHKTVGKKPTVKMYFNIGLMGILCKKKE